MKNNTRNKIIFSILYLTTLIGCCNRIIDTDNDTNKNENFTNIDPIPSFSENDVVIASGINFHNGEPVVVNPITGEKLSPLTDVNNDDCKINDFIISSGTRSARAVQNIRKNKKTTDCNIKIVDPNQELTNAIINSDKIINGTIRVNGENKEARFLISVTALYQGSNCALYIVNGKGFNFCSDTISNCSVIAPVINPDNPGYAGSTNGSYRRAVRKVCRQFSTWKDNDCNYLKNRYQTGALGLIYSRQYKQYIWKTCNRQRPEWGTCPPPVSLDKNISECINPIETP